MDSEQGTSRASLWWGLIPAMTVPALASFIYFVIFADEPFAQGIYGVSKAFILAWPLACVFLIWKESKQLRDRWKPDSLREHIASLPLGAALGVVIVGLMLLLLQTPFGDAVAAGAPAIRAKAEQLGFFRHFLLFAIFLSVAHSLIEEYDWRWFVFGNLRRVVTLRTAYVLGAVSFSAHHVIITAQFFPLWLAVVLSTFVGIGGFLWSWIYHRQKSLAGIWLSHAIVDAGIMWLGWRLMSELAG